jgi:hypothetical protein
MVALQGSACRNLRHRLSSLRRHPSGDVRSFSWIPFANMITEVVNASKMIAA